MDGIIYGFILGLLEASFGAWKDTLFEAFSWRKFIRSPIIATLCASILRVLLFPNAHWLLIGTSAVGLERTIVEAWKAMFRKPPSKFSLTDRDIGWLRKKSSRILSKIRSKS